MTADIRQMKKVPSTADHVPSTLAQSADERVRRRAYELYEERGREHGHAEEDWFRAEAEILSVVLRRGKVG